MDPIKPQKIVDDAAPCEAGDVSKAPTDSKTVLGVEEILSAAENRSLRMKADMVVLPLITIAATMAALDKVREPWHNCEV